jgi:signal transduction histidine kinase
MVDGGAPALPRAATRVPAEQAAARLDPGPGRNRDPVRRQRQLGRGFPADLRRGVAAYSVAAYGDRRGAYLGLAAFTAGYAVYALEDRNIQSGRTGELWAGAFFAVGLPAAWLGGVFVHSGRERAALQAVADEHERTAAVAVAEERSRLARELHDIVSHNLSVVVLQAGGARAQGEYAPAATLEKIECSSREALVEMRRLLGVQRESDGSASLAPQPGITELEALSATVRAAGLPVELTIEGAHDDLPPALQLSVYRIVQEALTNAPRPGPKAASACMRLANAT